MNNSFTDNVSFAVVAQVLPLLSIFGQDFVNQFFSQSIDNRDWIIFAVAPLGIGWILSAVVRIMGPRFLKSGFGKASEDVNLLEKDLTSSTSSMVSEIWNGHHVARIAGSARIEEFYIDYDILIDPKIQRDTYGLADPPLESHIEPRRPPNILLNLRPKAKWLTTQVGCIIACAFEGGFLVLATLMKFNSSLELRYGHIPLYAYVSTVAGTFSLGIGLIVCAITISRASIVIKGKKPKEEEKRRYFTCWLQRGTGDAAPQHTSYIIAKETGNEIIESHRNDSFWDIRSPGRDFLCLLILLCTGVGYVAQVIGVTGMHWPTQITLFGITLLMAGIRMFLHQIVRPSIAHQAFYRHEMDWLAIEVTLDPNFEKFSAKKPLPVWALYGGHSVAACIAPLPSDHNAVKSAKLLERRVKIADTCQWECPSTEMAQNLILAIENVANAWLPEPPTIKEFQWCVVVDLGEQKERPPFCLVYSTSRKRWEIRNEEKPKIESALSLWLYYDQSVYGKKFTKKFERSLLLLGPGDNNDLLLEVLQKMIGKPPARLCFVEPFSQTGVNGGENDEADEDYEAENVLSRRFEKRKCKRNRILGIYNEGGLQSPTFYNQNRASGQDHELQVKLIRPSLHTQRSASRSSTKLYNFNPGALSRKDRGELYAQHVFLAFAWAFVEKFRFYPELKVPKDLIADDFEDLEQLAYNVELTRLGDAQDVLLCLLPPLIHYGVLKRPQEERPQREPP